MKLIITFLGLMAAVSMASPATPVFTPILERATPCECEEVFCIDSFPAGCYCQNDAKRVCYEKCGGVEPTYQDCTFPGPTAKKPRATAPYARCGSRNLQCPSGTQCLEDPFLPEGSCGIKCDAGTGHCMPDDAPKCGGFPGFLCPNEDQVCVNDPRDTCDPNNGGADCLGYCFTPAY